MHPCSSVFICGQTQIENRKCLLWLFILTGCFFLLRCPVIGQYFDYHFDEHFYTNGALEMLSGGDYLTPHTADGQPRFNKPPLAYWLVVLGFKLFGVSAFSARLPFLLIGCALVALTYKLADLLLREKNAALLAAAILASNATFLYHAGYSITDGLVSLGVLLAHYGFMRVLVLHEHKRRNLFYGYLGTALAVATKGLPGVLPAVCAWLYALWLAPMRGNPPDCRAAIPEDCATSKQPESGSCPRVFGELLDGPAIFLGLLLCAWWPLVEACTYGTAFWKDFLYDQAGRRFESGHFVYGLARNLGINLLYYPAVLVKAFLPWSLVLPVLAVRFWSVLFAHLKANRPLWLYVAAACLVELIFYLPANIHRSRYLMPVFPLMALFMGSSMNLLFRGMRPARTVMAGVLIILAYSAFDLLGGPEFSRSPYVQVLEKLKANGIEEGKIGVGPRVMQELPAQLRVMSGGKLEFVSVNPQEDGGPAVMLIREESGAPPNYPGYRAVDAGYGFMNKKKSFLPGRNNDRLEWALSALRGNEEGFRASSRTKYWLLFKR